MTYLETAERYAQAWLWWRQERNLVEAGFPGAVSDRTEPTMPDMEVLMPAPPLVLTLAMLNNARAQYEKSEELWAQYAAKHRIYSGYDMAGPRAVLTSRS